MINIAISNLPALSAFFLLIGTYYYWTYFTIDTAILRLGYMFLGPLLIYPGVLTRLAIHYYPEETKKELVIKKGFNYLSAKEKRKKNDDIFNSSFSKVEGNYVFVYKKESINDPVKYTIYLKKSNNEYHAISTETCNSRVYPEAKYPNIHGSCYDDLIERFVKNN